MMAGGQRADALRFHTCLMSDGGGPAPLDERELADTVQTVLIDQLERWSAGVISLCATLNDSRVPLSRRRAGRAALLLETVPHEMHMLLSPAAFAPDRAAALLTETVTEAAYDMKRVHATTMRETAERLGTHLELLARLALVVRPLMPGWSAFITHCLRLPEDPAPGSSLHRPLDGAPLLTPGQRVAASLPVYFRLGADTGPGTGS